MTEVLRLESLRYERAGDGAFVIEVGTLALAPGQVLGIVGPSGCGKSTLIDILALLRRPTRVARFELQGTDVAALWQRGAVDACTALRAAQVGVVLQTGGLLPSLTVLENVRLAQRLLGARDEAWVQHLLAALDLHGLGERRPAQLSIGQRQRVAIARALAHRPALLLADEPTASLGIDHAPAALDLLLALARDSGAALVIVSHDLDLLRDKGVPLRACVVQQHAVVLEEAA
ncbi:MAG: ATP-binding cassette domain-containing protein [Piscinibacter sp.]|uniref:ABC transporter ATP-binding protein n=1 Tax=Piscinibacter sp. TaxID=1903157 RepID=UPI00258C5B82|nr:ATP-binding cassette domain-containing protein [Piscinibacter sp.]MCW5666708.1 ATP-binding cassette domain-containing protein [Piscinibacter sp.]